MLTFEEPMWKQAVILAMLMLLTGPMTKSGAAEPPDSGSGQLEIRDKSKDNACDCCQKCQAAKSSTKAKEEEGPPKTNGCEECCTKCGTPLPTAPEQIPPEIIEKPRR